MDKQFLEMIKENERIIYKVASFYTNEEHPIGDLYQEIVINLWRAFSKFRGESKRSTWIYRIALNTCISLYRRRKTKMIYVEVLADIPDESDDNEQIKELYRLITKLGNIERALILLYLEDKSYNEIAEIMGLTVSNVATKLSRTKEKMREMSNAQNI